MSEHARYRQQLSWLRAGELDTTVERVAVERGWAQPGIAACRAFGRFEPRRSPWATLLYSLGRMHVRVDAFDERDGTIPADAVAGAAGALRFTKVENDGVVAGLRTVLREHPGASIVRYRPGQRCVLRVDDRFVKLVRPELGVRLHEAGSALWRARCDGWLPFRVAEPDRWDAETGASGRAS